MSNRLAAETSPYLLQHADNPVDWHPWGPEALARARREARPILLSIGYSACHWCHVMAHESFEDAATAALMNRLFVNIKVDREERPDLDQIYQAAHQLIARRSGGWPLTMFLTPDGLPFYGGTYFPPRTRHGLPAFAELLERVAEVWQERRGAIEAQGREVVAALDAWSAARPPLDGELDRTPIVAAVAELARLYDPEHGGFGGAPKFPRPGDLALLLRHWRHSGDAAARDMALTTLRAMAAGGIHDQLGGGFCRYSTDAHWSIPHFEKMLYDNALLLGLYVDAWRIEPDPLFARVVAMTIDWIAGEMRAPSGVLYSSRDADSEGQEGRFYVWQRDEVAALLDEPERTLVLHHFGLLGRPNFEGEAWHLRVVESLADAARAAGVDPAAAPAVLDAARAKLLHARQRRVRPGLDDKSLTSWNALAIAALARAARVFGRDDWLALARGTLAGIATTHWRDGRLLATSRAGHAQLDAYLDDYAFLLEALVEMLQTDFRVADFEFATQVAAALVAGFVDRDSGDFVFTSHAHETLIHRPRVVHDNATPAGSAVAVLALLRLARISGRDDWAAVAERALRVQLAALGDQPAGAASLLVALDEWLGGGQLLVVGGGAESRRAWLQALAAVFAPDALVISLPPEPGLPPPLAVVLSWTAEAAVGWLCAEGICRAPEARLEELVRTLRENGKTI